MQVTTEDQGRVVQETEELTQDKTLLETVQFQVVLQHHHRKKMIQLKMELRKINHQTTLMKAITTMKIHKNNQMTMTKNLTPKKKKNQVTQD